MSCRRLSRCFSIVGIVALVAVLCGAHVARAATAEQKCIKGRYLAASKYGACQQKAVALFHGGSLEFGSQFQDALAKCRGRYASTWPRLQSKYPSTTCDTARFEVNGDGTVTDHLTGLQWEQKTDDGSIHDKDNLYNWTAGGPNGITADGTQFVTFLPALNGGPCFGGNCDWRLPTLAELESIVPSECTGIPCIDEATFGPTVPARYQSASLQLDPGFPTDQTFVWGVYFDIGFASGTAKVANSFVRAVRGGL